MTRRLWTRDELIVAFNLYCKLPFGQLHTRNPAIIELAGLLGRTAGAIAMKLVNFAALDPQHEKRGVSGLKNTSQADAMIWEEFNSDWARVGAESEQAWRRLRGEEAASGAEEPGAEESLERRSGETATQRLLTVRLGQAFFRDVVLASYNQRCCICDLPDVRLLVAGHIIPWAAREELRVNPRNGLCLCVLHDRAFDRGLISIDPKLTVLVSPELRQHLPHPVVEQMFAAFEGKEIHRPEKFLPDPEYLQYHVQNIFQSA
jgi:predicted restriction endonuclease